MKTVLTFRRALLVTLLTLAATASAHWPDQAPHQIADLGEFRFEGGGVIPNLRMSYVTHGKLNTAKDNAILFQRNRWVLWPPNLYVACQSLTPRIESWNDPSLEGSLRWSARRPSVMSTGGS